MRKAEDKNFIIEYSDGIAIRTHNKRVILSNDDDHFEFIVHQVDKTTKEIKGAKDVTAMSHVTDKGIMETRIKISHSTLLQMFELIQIRESENYVNHQTPLKNNTIII